MFNLFQLSSIIGPSALIISCTEDLRQILHSVAAIHATRGFNVGEVMDSTLRQRLPPVFNQFVSVENLHDSILTADDYSQKATNERCAEILKVVNESKRLFWYN